MFLRGKKGQSTMEYILIISGVTLIVSGVISTAMKAGLREQFTRSNNFMRAAGSDVPEYYDADAGSAKVFGSDWRSTTVDAADYEDKTVTFKGGSEKRYLNQTSETTSTSIEAMEALN